MQSLRSRVRNLEPPVKVAVLVILAIAGALALLAVGPIERTSYTYQFPDARTMLGVPFFLNVASNLPFVIVGALGLRGLRHQVPELRPALAVLYIGILFTGFGSAHHHLAPSFDRLLFDRLPMTLAFAGVFAVALGDRIDSRMARTWLVPLVAIAVASAIYWYMTGHLRPYVFVQGYPMIAIPAILLLYRGRWLDGRHFMIAVALYGAAKVVERLDSEIYELGHLISGHSVKHLLAGWATWYLVTMTRGSRHPLGG